MRYTGAVHTGQVPGRAEAGQRSRSTNARSAAEQNWTIRIWSSVSAPNVKEITNIVRIICLRINMYTEVKGADTGGSRAGSCLFCYNGGKAAEESAFRLCLQMALGLIK